MHVLCDGTVAGKHKVSCDMPFHAAVLKARPDLNCVLHAHSKALAAYSAARKALPLGVLPRIEAEIGRIGTAPYRRPGSKALGQSVEQAFRKGCDVVILQNHGVMAGGQSLKDALDKLEKLERLARICTTAAQAGAALTPPGVRGGARCTGGDRGAPPLCPGGAGRQGMRCAGAGSGLGQPRV